MNKLEAFKKYLWYKKAYYDGTPLVRDSYYDEYEQHCRDLFPGDQDFYMAGYGQAHEDRLKELKRTPKDMLLDAILTLECKRDPPNTLELLMLIKLVVESLPEDEGGLSNEY